MNTLPEIPSVGPRKTIAYDYTRWDFFAHWMTAILRSRILQVSTLAAFLLITAFILIPQFGKLSVLALIIEEFLYLFGYIVFLFFWMVVLGLANTFLLQHRGIVCRHVLEITEEGLIERTDYNENLHRWPSICRITSLCGYLFVYVSDTISHPIPKRSFAPAEIEAFEAEVREMASAARLK